MTSSPSPVEAARGAIAAIGEQLDRLEASEPWSAELEQQRQALWKRYVEARRALAEATLDADDQEAAP